MDDLEATIKRLEEVECDPPQTGGSGQGLDALYDDPVAQKNKPSGGYKKHGFDTYHLNRYDGTDYVQWFGRRISGYFYPYGKLMRLTKSGITALRSRSLHTSGDGE